MITTGFRAGDSLSRRLFLSAQRNLQRKKALPTGSSPTCFPKAVFRERIVRDLKISDTDFNLLRAIGGENAPAPYPSFRNSSQPSAEQSYRPIDDEELAGLISQRGQPYSWSEEKRARFSLAGTQNKFPILVREGKYLLPQGESPSSHILKFEIEGYRNVPAYETFTTLLARAVGLPVINIELRSINKIHYTITERYDRFPSMTMERFSEHTRKTSAKHLGTVMKENTKKTADRPSHSASGCSGMYRVIRPRIFHTCCAGRSSTCLRAIPTATPRIYRFCIRQMERFGWRPFTILCAPGP